MVRACPRAVGAVLCTTELPPEGDEPALSELDRAVDILVEMKDLAEAAVGMAYSSLLFNNLSEVIHQRCDSLKINIQLKLLHAMVEQE